MSELLARIFSLAGPPRPMRVRRAGAEVLTIPGRYCVTYALLGPEAIGIVDVGSQADVPGILAALERAGRAPSQVRWAMPSHLHFDHVMGLDAFVRRLGIPVQLGVAGHEGVTGRRRLRFPGRIQLLRAIATWPMQGLPFPPLADWRGGFDFGFPWARNRFHAELATPLADGDPLPGLPGWRLRDGPGHADDALCLHHAEAGFLVPGDSVRNFYGGEWNPLVCDREAYARTQAMIRSLHVETIFPAHGPVIDGPGIVERLASYPVFVP